MVFHHAVVVRLRLRVPRLRRVVVDHVVVLAEVVVLPVDDRERVDARDLLAALVELDERVESPVDDREEEGHADERLEPHDEEEPRRGGEQAEEGGRDEPVDDAAAHEQVVLVGHVVRAEVVQRRGARLRARRGLRHRRRGCGAAGGGQARARGAPCAGRCA